MPALQVSEVHKSIEHLRDLYMSLSHVTGLLYHVLAPAMGSAASSNHGLGRRL